MYGDAAGWTLHREAQRRPLRGGFLSFSARSRSAMRPVSIFSVMGFLRNICMPSSLRQAGVIC